MDKRNQNDIPSPPTRAKYNKGRDVVVRIKRKREEEPLSSFVVKEDYNYEINKEKMKKKEDGDNRNKKKVKLMGLQHYGITGQSELMFGTSPPPNSISFPSFGRNHHKKRTSNIISVQEDVKNKQDIQRTCEYQSDNKRRKLYRFLYRLEEKERIQQEMHSIPIHTLTHLSDKKIERNPQGPLKPDFVIDVYERVEGVDERDLEFEPVWELERCQLVFGDEHDYGYDWDQYDSDDSNREDNPAFDYPDSYSSSDPQYDTDSSHFSDSSSELGSESSDFLGDFEPSFLPHPPSEHTSFPLTPLKSTPINIPTSISDDQGDKWATIEKPDKATNFVYDEWSGIEDEGYGIISDSEQQQ